MDYFIAIPTYNRASIINKMTLKMLKDNNIPKNIITIYVVKEELDEYKKVLDNNYKIVVGKKGLVEQRKFIENQYKENTNILFLDDDIESVDLSLEPQYKTLNDFIIDAFSITRKENAFIWSIYPVYNKFYREKNKTMTDYLTIMIGAFYGIINRPNNSNLIGKLTNGEKEDTERSILYFKEDGKTIRFNKIGFKTKYFKSIGGLGSTKERIPRTIEATNKLLELYPEYGKRKIRKNGINEFVLNRIKAKSIEGGKIKSLSNLPINDKESTEVIIDNIELTTDIKDLQDKLLLLLEKAKIPKISQKRKKVIGDVGRTFTMGIGYRIAQPIGEFVANKNEPELFKLVVKYGNKILPTGFKYSAITINKNLKAKKHLDVKNTGLSAITFLGSYTGGGLYVYDPKTDNAQLINTKNKLIIFNGANLPHETEDFEGTRYAIIYYNQVLDRKISGIKMEGI